MKSSEQAKKNLDRIMNNPDLILSMPNATDDEILLAFDLKPDLIEQYDDLPVSIQVDLLKKDYKLASRIKNMGNLALSVVDAQDHNFAKSLPNITDKQYWCLRRKYIGLGLSYDEDNNSKTAQEKYSLSAQAFRNKSRYYIVCGLIFVFGCAVIMVDPQIGILLFILSIGYFVKVASIGVKKHLIKYGDPDSIIREIDADLSSAEKHSRYSADIVMTQGYIIRMKHVGTEKITIMPVRSIKTILRDKGDSKPAYNKFYKDSVVLCDEFGNKLELECKMKRGKKSIMDSVVANLKEQNPMIAEGKYQRQTITE